MSEKILQDLYRILEERKQANPDSSYVAELYGLGTAKIAQKVGEEAVETVIEAMNLEAGRENAAEKLKEESADLLFHLMVLWCHFGITPEMVTDILKSRLGRSGLQKSHQS